MESHRLRRVDYSNCSILVWCDGLICQDKEKKIADMHSVSNHILRTFAANDIVILWRTVQWGRGDFICRCMRKFFGCDLEIREEKTWFFEEFKNEKLLS